MPTLVVFGRLSDHVGRRPVLLAGLGAAAGGLALFAAASSIGWLFAARVLQGLAVGMISGAATSALVEYDDNRSQRPAMLAGLAQAAGSGLGPLAAGVLAQWAPAPRTLSYLVWLAGTLVAVVIVARLPEPAPDLREPWRVQWPRIPPEIRRDFSRVSLSAACVWASIALYLSIVPSYTGKLLHNHNLALYGVIAALALASSSVAQLIGRRCAITSRRRAQGFGLATLAAGLVLLVMAAPVHSVAALLVSAATTGAGHGLAFLNAQDELNAIAPADRRGEVTSAFISCIYLLVSGASVTAGLLASRWPLSLSVEVVAGTLAAVATVVCVWQLAPPLAAANFSRWRSRRGVAAAASPLPPRAR
jgi:MFS family permease